MRNYTTKQKRNQTANQLLLVMPPNSVDFLRLLRYFGYNLFLNNFFKNFRTYNFYENTKNN